jgi:hypothetical protein
MDPATQPCYAAVMPDTDSRRAVVPLNAQRIRRRLRLPTLRERAGEHPFAGRRNEFGLSVSLFGDVGLCQIRVSGDAAAPGTVTDDLEKAT